MKAANFASIAADATSVGRAAFLEQATHGASSWVRARPRGHDDNAPQYARFAAPVVSKVTTSAPHTGMHR